MSNLQTLVFYATPEHDCSYLADQKATTMFVDPKAKLDRHMYTQLSQLGFRRSGNHYYRPHCNACQACIPVRIPSQSFKPNRSQKRVLNKNRDLKIQVMTPDFHEDHYLLYEKYIRERHSDGDMYPPSRDQYRSFLIEGHPCTRFVEFSQDEHIVAIAVVDELEDGLSAIYTFFDPDLDARSPGTLAVLWQLEEAKRRDLPYVYLGYFIRACPKMSYKTRFRPFEARINDIWFTEDELIGIAEQSVLS
ncbi:MAG: arginyltransferase [Oleiphilaceae bacterium]|nr:arginyltransferase [Oleiphilaceae bacterium]